MLSCQISHCSKLKNGLCKVETFRWSLNIKLQQDSVLVPQANVVLQCKLDPIDDLRELWHHGEHCDADEVLHPAQRDTLRWTVHCLSI